MALALPRTTHQSGQSNNNTQIGVMDTGHSQVPHTNTASESSTSDHHDMAKEKEHKSRIEIHLDSPHLFIQGMGQDVEPALLSGHVAIYLNDATSIKEIRLQLRGKAHLPVAPSDSGSMSSTPVTYIVCKHDWSFLEGEKKHGHTLKAGRHLFPFQLRIGGSLPSTLPPASHGGAEVSYKLRAQAVRHTFAFNQTHTASRPVYLIRSLSPEAMEYQQTLEIENTWPEKVMYSIMIPHKAWAAGDKITAIVKLSPITKGICILQSTTTIREQTKVFTRGGSHEQSRIVASVKHEFSNGRVVAAEDNLTWRPRSQGSFPSHIPPEPSTFHTNLAQSSSPSFSSAHQHLPHNFAQYSTPPISPQLANSGLPDASPSSTPSDPESDDVVARLDIHVPLTITPTHNLEPVSVTHRIRWNFLILNKDGHTSELRCSLPLYLLDYRLLNESRKYSAGARRLILGEDEVPVVEEENTQLPSYDQHVRDRIANMYISDAAALRVSNPWVAQGTSPVQASNQSGHLTPVEIHPHSHLPHQPDPNSSNTPLEWVNSELLLSLSDEPIHMLHPGSPPHAESSGTDSESPSRTQSRAQSRARPQSRPNHSHMGFNPFSSRNTSPERRHQHSHSHLIPQTPVASPNETYIHNCSRASRDTETLLTPTMKPSSSFHSGWMSRSSSTQHIATLQDFDRERDLPTSNNNQQNMPLRALSLPDLSSTGTELLHRAFTAVPDYGVASRGFIGGVPPLSTMRGLPSYDETVGTQSEVDLGRRSARFSIDGQNDQEQALSPSSPVSP